MSFSPSTRSRYSFSIRMSMHFCAWCSEEGAAVKRKKNTFTDGRERDSPTLPRAAPSHFPQSPLAPSPPGVSHRPPRVSEGEGAARFLREKTPGVRVPGLQAPRGPRRSHACGTSLPPGSAHAGGSRAGAVRSEQLSKWNAEDFARLRIRPVFFCGNLFYVTKPSSSVTVIASFVF